MSRDLDQNKALAADDAGIEAAAIALAWAGRPVMVSIEGVSDAHGWWQIQTELDRRLYLYRARVCCVAWEEYWKKIEEKKDEQPHEPDTSGGRAQR